MNVNRPLAFPRQACAPCERSPWCAPEVPAFSWTLETCVVTGGFGTLMAGSQEGPSDDQTTCQGMS